MVIKSKNNKCPRTNRACPHNEGYELIKNAVERLQDDTTKLEVKIDKNHAELNAKLDKFIESVPQKFVSNERFANVEKLVYGLVGILLTLLVTYGLKALFKW